LTQRQLWAGAVTGVQMKRNNAHVEAGILNAVLKVLRLHPKVAWCARMNSGLHHIDGRWVRFGFVGCSDIVGQMKDGRWLAIEVKGPHGRVTEEQRAFIEVVQRNGGCAGVARSIEQALEIVEGRA
jgi:hypothetical protein